MLAQPAYRFYIAHLGDTFLGFGVVALLSETEVALLEYLAIHTGMRGRGLGRLLFGEIARAVHRDRSTLLIEVESDRQGSPGFELQTRRKRFYRSLGAREIAGLLWLMPEVAEAPPPPMEMLAHGELASALGRHTLQHWLTRLYVEVYGQSPDDSRLTAMMASLPATVPLI